jgi:hypothetical protein
MTKQSHNSFRHEASGHNQNRGNRVSHQFSWPAVHVLERAKRCIGVCLHRRVQTSMTESNQQRARHLLILLGTRTCLHCLRHKNLIENEHWNSEHLAVKHKAREKAYLEKRDENLLPWRLRSQRWSPHCGPHTCRSARVSSCAKPQQQLRRRPHGRG